MSKNKAKGQVEKVEQTTEVDEMGDKASVTLGVFFDKAINKYVQVKLMFDPDTDKCVILSKKTLTHNRLRAIMQTSTVDLVKILTQELE